LRLSAFILLLTAQPALSDGLMRRQVQFNVVTIPTETAPEDRSRDFIATVGKGVEFQLGPVGDSGLNIVPVAIDVGDRVIRFDYSGNLPGQFAPGHFNGYVLTFLTDCVLIAGAEIVPSETSFPMTNEDLTVTPGSLSVNVSAIPFSGDDRLTIAIDVGDCPLS
jgi:hypothetical protein